MVQLKMVHFDLRDRPNLRDWVKRMESYEGYEKVHKLFERFVKMQQMDEKANL